MSADTRANAGIQAVQAGGEAMIGMAAFGKTALVLAVMVGLIVLCGWLLKRFGPGQAGGRELNVIASRAVGSKERVVVVELEDTWLVLGVGGGQVTKLHERPAPEARPETEAARHRIRPEDSFARRFAQAMSNNMRGGGPGKRQ